MAALCLAERTGADVIGVEKQATYAALARENGVYVVETDIAALPADLRQKQFHHVIFNPPYFDPAKGAAAPNSDRQAARAEDTPLNVWFDVALKRVRPKGHLTVIHRAERLPDLLKAMPVGFGAVEVLPLQARVGRAAHLVLVRARKDSRTPFKLHAPKTIHAAARHEGDHPDYTPEFERILQDGAPLTFSD